MAPGPLVRQAVRQLLQSSPAYRELPPESRREIAHDTARVACYMADPHGLLSKQPRSRAGAAQRAGRPRAAPLRALARKAARTRGPAAAHLAVLGDPHVLDASAAAATLLEAVDFPDFVSDLINGVFNAIVGTSIQQMQAYAELIRRVSETVDRLQNDGISPARAREWLAQRFAAQLELDPRGRLRWRADPRAGAREIASALRMSGAPADARDLVTAARRRIAIDRQQMLATMVMMGINRVVVADGKVSARRGRARR